MEQEIHFTNNEFDFTQLSISQPISVQGGAYFTKLKMKNDTLYLLGPGTTVKAISNSLNLSKALLGIDAIYNKNLIGKDINEKGILDLLNNKERGQ